LKERHIKKFFEVQEKVDLSILAVANRAFVSDDDNEQSSKTVDKKKKKTK
jgi:hypothetical protein